VSATVLTFSALLKGERFRVVAAGGAPAGPVFTKVAKNTCRDVEGQWLTISPHVPVEPVEICGDTLQLESGGNVMCREEHGHSGAHRDGRRMWN